MWTSLRTCTTFQSAYSLTSKVAVAMFMRSHSAPEGHSLSPKMHKTQNENMRRRNYKVQRLHMPLDQHMEPTQTQKPPKNNSCTAQTKMKANSIWIKHSKSKRTENDKEQALKLEKHNSGLSITAGQNKSIRSKTKQYRTKDGTSAAKLILNERVATMHGNGFNMIFVTTSVTMHAIHFSTSRGGELGVVNLAFILEAVHLHNDGLMIAPTTYRKA